MRLPDLGEKKLISMFVEPLFHQGGIEIGIGDDAAVLRLTDALSLVLTIDRIPEEPIARSLGLMNDYSLGRYLVAANLSDLAAMGANPLALLLAISFPPDYAVRNLQEFLQGVRDIADNFGTPIVGGDTNSSSVLDLTAAAIGLAPPGTALKRSGAKSGDIIFSTGVPGLFGTALAYYLVAKPAGCKLSLPEESFLLSRFQAAIPRIHEGLLLRESGLATACQDISDGVGQTVREIARSSNLGFKLDKRLLIEAGPKCLVEVSRYCACSQETIILGPGADFELIFTADPALVSRMEGEFSRHGWPLNPLGCMTDTGEEIVLDGGEVVAMGEVGWQHFTGRSDLDAIRSIYERS